MANAVAVAVPATTPAMAPIASRRCDDGASPARTIVGSRACQGLVQLDPHIAEVAETLFGVLLQQRRNSRLNLRRRGVRQPIPGGLACEDRGDRV